MNLEFLTDGVQVLEAQMQMREREDALRLARLENAEMRAKQDLDVAKMRHLEARLRCLEETIASGSGTAGGGARFLATPPLAYPTAAAASTSSSSSPCAAAASAVAGGPSGNLLVCGAFSLSRRRVE